ncbi:MAG: HAMP domain-containing protein [Eubacterium sp.]
MAGPDDVSIHGNFAVALVVSGTLSYLTAKKIAKPIVKLTRTTKNMAIGNYSVRADIKNGGEICVLTKNFNTMADAGKKYKTA